MCNRGFFFYIPTAHKNVYENAPDTQHAKTRASTAAKTLSYSYTNANLRRFAEQNDQLFVSEKCLAQNSFFGEGN